MSRERISIFNYEAFYLDFIEGNLNTEDTAALMAFLEAHPDLEEEDTSMPSLETQDFDKTLLNGLKKELKEVDNADPITPENIEHFLIAEAEGILLPERVKELNTLVEGNAKAEKERRLTALLALRPDATEVYKNKDGLKRKSKIVFWSYAASMAACIAIAIMIIWNPPGPDDPLYQAGTTPEIIENPEETPKNERVPEITPSETQPAAIQGGTSYTEKTRRSGSVPSGYPTSNHTAQKPVIAVNALPKNSARQIKSSFEQSELKPVTKQFSELEAAAPNNASHAFSGFAYMKDPIEPITAQIRKHLDTDFDFKTAKTTEKQQGGFYLKIGKFELSRKKSKRGD